MLDMRCKLRLLSAYGSINIYDAKAFLLNYPCDLTQQLDAVGIFVSCIVIGKELTDVSECECAEQRIHYRMGENICVGMSEQTFCVVYLHSAEYKLSAFRKLVNVIAVSYPHFSAPPVIYS
jgi:hypothetical protein